VIGNAFVLEAPRLWRLNNCALYVVGAFAGEDFEKAKIVLILGSKVLSLRPVRQCPRQAPQLCGTYLPDDFSRDAWRGHCLTGRGDRA